MIDELILGLCGAGIVFAYWWDEYSFLELFHFRRVLKVLGTTILGGLVGAYLAQNFDNVFQIVCGVVVGGAILLVAKNAVESDMAKHQKENHELWEQLRKGMS